MKDAENAIARQYELAAETLIKNLKSRHFEAYYCKNRKEAADKALSLIPEGATVSWGGSVSVQECGIIERVKEAGRPVIDRDAAKTPEERMALMRKALVCDYFLASVNAICEDGVFINIDGFGNRVAAITFGPANVILVVGMNKLCRTLEGARERARNYAAPVNVQRVYKTAETGAQKTPCTISGVCADCKSPDSVCSYIVETRLCKVPGRIKIILVGESLGF